MTLRGGTRRRRSRRCSPSRRARSGRSGCRCRAPSRRSGSSRCTPARTPRAQSNADDARVTPPALCRRPPRRAAAAPPARFQSTGRPDSARSADRASASASAFSPRRRAARAAANRSFCAASVEGSLRGGAATAAAGAASAAHGPRPPGGRGRAGRRRARRPDRSRRQADLATAEAHRHDALVNDDLRPNEGRARRRFRNDRDLEARPSHLDLGVGGRDHEAPANRKLGHLGLQRAAVEVEALRGAELGHARRRRSADAQPGAGVEREQEMPRARNTHRRSRGDAIARRGCARAAGGVSIDTPAPSTSATASPRRRRAPRRGRDRSPRRSRRAESPRHPRRTARRRLPRHARSRPRARRAGVRGRGARARSRRRPPFDPATCRRSASSAARRARARAARRAWRGSSPGVLILAPPSVRARRPARDRRRCARAAPCGRAPAGSARRPG